MSKDRPLSNLKRALGDFTVIISDFIKQEGKSDVLEIGCGYGLPIIQLKHMFGDSLSIYGLNLSLNHCQPRKAAIAGIKSNELSFTKATRLVLGVDKPNYLCADTGLSLPFPSGKFDFIYSRMALGFVKDKARCIEEIYRVLRPGGRCRCDLSLIRWNGHPRPWNILFKVYQNDENRPFEDLLDKYSPYLQVNSTPTGQLFFEIQKTTANHLDLGLEMISVTDLSTIQSDLIFLQSQYRTRTSTSG